MPRCVQVRSAAALRQLRPAAAELGRDENLTLQVVVNAPSDAASHVPPLLPGEIEIDYHLRRNTSHISLSNN